MTETKHSLVTLSQVAKNLRGMGFSKTEIAEVLQLKRREVVDLLGRKRARLRRLRAELKAVKAEIDAIAAEVTPE